MLQWTNSRYELEALHCGFSIVGTLTDYRIKLSYTYSHNRNRKVAQHETTHGVMGGGQDLSGLGPWRLGDLAMGLCLLPGAAMFASSLARQTSIHTSPNVLRTVRPHLLFRDPLSVPLRPITLSLSAERFSSAPHTRAVKMAVRKH